MISVIVPVHKVERYLHQCIDSILNQTYQDLEILLIDDGSPDRCGEICEEYAKIDNRIRVFHTKNNGLSAARNLGLREAKGEYIGFVDSDDWIEPNMYEVLLHRLEETETSISTCEFLCEYLKCTYAKRKIKNKVYTGTDAIRALLSEQFYNTVWDKLYKKTCWENIRFPEKHVYEEIATLYNVVLVNCSVSSVPIPLYHYRMRENSIIHTRSMDVLMDYWFAYYNRYLFFSNHPKLKNDQGIIDDLEKQIAIATVRTWRWIYKVSPQKRNYDFLHFVSSFERTHFPLLGKKNWELSLCAVCFLSRYVNSVSFFVLFYLICIYNAFKYKSKQPFPPE